VHTSNRVTSWLCLRARRQGTASDTYYKHKVVPGEPSDRPSLCLERMHFLLVACIHIIQNNLSTIIRTQNYFSCLWWLGLVIFLWDPWTWHKINGLRLRSLTCLIKWVGLWLTYIVLYLFPNTSRSRQVTFWTINFFIRPTNPTLY
jgi:hypothetical protein